MQLLSKIYLIPLTLLCACQTMNVPPGPAQTADPGDAPDRLDRHVPELLQEHNAAGAGVALIQDGAIVWTGYYGEQGPGQAASRATVFNYASVAKTVAAETLIALAAKGLISLDEPIHRFVGHPDLENDPRFEALTARILLSHRGGLLNWPAEYEDGRAAFIHDPGQSFSYSGMGIELAAQYAEDKIGKDFEALAFEHLLTPLGISDISLGRIKPWMQGRLATPMDSSGAYFDIADSSGRLASQPTEGDWSAADDLLATVEAYAEFMTALFANGWLDDTWRRERETILSDLDGNAIWNCEPAVVLRCAEEYGHSLGWMVYRFGHKTVLKHGGNDAGENALVIYSPETRSGAVIAVNGGNGIFVSTQILDLLGEEPEIAAYYRHLVGKFYGIELRSLR